MKSDLDGIPATPILPEHSNPPPPTVTVSTVSGQSTTPTARRSAHAGAGQPHRLRRWIPWIGAVLLLALVVAGLWPQPEPVETATVTMGNLRATVNEEGKTRIRQRFVVSAPVSGQLRRIPLKAGAEVKAHETIVAVIDPLPPTPLDARTRAQAEARRDTAAANLERARAAHRFAASDLRRAENLAARKTISDEELEDAQWREVAAAKDVAAADAALRQAEAELLEFTSPGEGAGPRKVTEVNAPSNGRVLRVFEESSRVVSAGTPLMEVGDPSQLEVVIEVLSRDGAALAPGTRIILEQWGGPQPLEARVRLVEPAAFTKVSALGVEEQRVNVVADIVTPLEQRPNLGDNFRVEARIVMWDADDALKVPSGALFRHGKDWAAFVVREGRAHLHPVSVGRSSGTETQVIDGLKEGDQVVVYPGERIRDGQRVKPIKVSVE